MSVTRDEFGKWESLDQSRALQTGQRTITKAVSRLRLDGAGLDKWSNIKRAMMPRTLVVAPYHSLLLEPFSEATSGDRPQVHFLPAVNCRAQSHRNNGRSRSQSKQPEDCPPAQVRTLHLTEPERDTCLAPVHVSLRGKALAQRLPRFSPRAELSGSPLSQTRPAMCQYEALNYQCGHQQRRIYKHCHFARNDPEHRCYGAWTVSREVSVHSECCPSCARSRDFARMHQQSMLLAAGRQ